MTTPAAQPRWCRNEHPRHHFCSAGLRLFRQGSDCRHDFGSTTRPDWCIHHLARDELHRPRPLARSLRWLRGCATVCRSVLRHRSRAVGHRVGLGHQRGLTQTTHRRRRRDWCHHHRILCPGCGFADQIWFTWPKFRQCPVRQHSWDLHIPDLGIARGGRPDAAYGGVPLPSVDVHHV